MLEESWHVDGWVGLVPEDLALLLQSWVSWQLRSLVARDLGKVASYKLHTPESSNSYFAPLLLTELNMTLSWY